MCLLGLAFTVHKMGRIGLALKFNTSNRLPEPKFKYSGEALVRMRQRTKNEIVGVSFARAQTQTQTHRDFFTDFK